MNKPVIFETYKTIKSEIIYSDPPVKDPINIKVTIEKKDYERIEKFAIEHKISVAEAITGMLTEKAEDTLYRIFSDFEMI